MTAIRPGYFGKKRNEIHKKFDEIYSSGNWRLAWELGSLFLSKSEALQVYEDAYFVHLLNKRDTLSWLIATASEVYDNAISNVESGFDYEKQERESNHYQDIAIRRVLRRLGTWFEGDHLLEVRGNGEGKTLSPLFIPFHIPFAVKNREISDFSGKGKWWRNRGVPDNLETWYQESKVLQVRERK